MGQQASSDETACAGQVVCLNVSRGNSSTCEDISRHAEDPRELPGSNPKLTSFSKDASPHQYVPANMAYLGKISYNEVSRDRISTSEAQGQAERGCVRWYTKRPSLPTRERCRWGLRYGREFERPKSDLICGVSERENYWRAAASQNVDPWQGLGVWKDVKVTCGPR